MASPQQGRHGAAREGLKETVSAITGITLLNY